MPQNNNEKVAIPEVSFPKGGGAIQGMGESLNGGGMSGTVSLNVPLPITPGRGFAPTLALQYASGNGNSPFGLGFNLSLPSINRRTSKGVPQYSEQDVFLDIDGEILAPETRSGGEIISSQKEVAGKSYKVTRYFPIVEGRFDHLSYWQGGDAQDSFWFLGAADGNQHVFGKSAEARIANPAKPEQCVSWLLEESVSPNGEHIYYLHKAENAEGVDTTSPIESVRERRAQRYLKQVRYGNRTAAQGLYLMSDTGLPPVAKDWLFELVFDYGEHAADLDATPNYEEIQNWLARADAFSGYAAGFEVRTHRLCRQVLMFHRFDELGEAPTLVNRLALEYDESNIVTRLRAAYSTGYGIDPATGQAASINTPPLEFNFTTAFEVGQAQFKPFDALEGMNDGVLYQMVDLYGEGLPGVLYRDGSSYLYRAPCRDKDSDDKDAVAYAPWRLLPDLPTAGLPLEERRALMDLTGDGRLDWVISQPGLAGFFTLGSEGQWQNFTPFDAFPTEFLESSAQLADLVGGGLSDLALIGPKSVRLYINRREKGFEPPIDVAHTVSDTLPLFNAAENELVAFSDVLGSGQGHLVRVRYDRLECWPNLGRGRFGQAIRVANLPFKETEFNPSRVLLADLDGSGAADLIYIERDQLSIFLNTSGNGLAAPVQLPFPKGMAYDNLCHVNFADVKGTGCATLVITQPHMTLKHWICEFNTAGKPYLLERLNNNRGLDVSIRYRSSAQEWLDEKAASPKAVSHLPFPVQVVSQMLHADEITGNTLTQRYSYRHGFYDGHEREFRGFGHVMHLDTEAPTETATADEKDTLTAPVLRQTWFRVGAEQDDAYANEYYKGDSEAQSLGKTRLVDQTDKELTNPDAATLYDMRRALRGRVTREEVYGIDQTPDAAHPYTVTEFRYQVRIVQAGHPNVLLPLQLEQITWQYERTPSDPLCTHDVTLQVDNYGTVTHTATVHYPRRIGATTPVEYSDEQQQILRLTEHKTPRVLHFDQDPQQWRLSLTCETKTNALTFRAGVTVDKLLGYEQLIDQSGLPQPLPEPEQIEWTRHYYIAPGAQTPLPFGQATREALFSHIEQAEITNQDLTKAMEGFLTGEALQSMMADAQYLNQEGYYWRPSARACYASLTGFMHLTCQIAPFKDTSAKTQFDYDAYACCLKQVTDALGNVTQVLHDYRRLQPQKIIDLNQNTQEAAYDPLGRLRVSASYGTENKRPIGFTPVEQYRTSITTVEAALADPSQAIQQAAVVYYDAAFSWMGQLDPSALPSGIDQATLRKLGFITTAGWIRARYHWHNAPPVGSDWSAEDWQQLIQLFNNTPRTPIHSVAFTHDRYPDDAQRQIRCAIVFADGFGRSLQTKQRVDAGDAWVADDKGNLVLQGGQPLTQNADVRWVVSGRVEYNNKGLPVRTYQPYFINTYQYVNDASLRQCGHYDTYYYDPLGRNVQAKTAAGYWRRTTLGVWFDIHEDENDTDATSTQSAQSAQPTEQMLETVESATP